jgi:hypothetical protein
LPASLTIALLLNRRLAARDAGGKLLSRLLDARNCGIAAGRMMIEATGAAPAAFAESGSPGCGNRDFSEPLPCKDLEDVGLPGEGRFAWMPVEE